jgi:hypothetical protein
MALIWLKSLRCFKPGDLTIYLSSSCSSQLHIKKPRVDVANFNTGEVTSSHLSTKTKQEACFQGGASADKKMTTPQLACIF